MALSLSVDPWTTSEECFFFSISLVFSRATWLELGPITISLASIVLHGISKNVPCLQWNKEAAGWESEGWTGIVAWRIGPQKDFAVALAYPRGIRRTVQPSAGTSKGWKTQAITLVLSFRLASVPGLWKPRSSLFGPQFRWKRWWKHFLVTSFGFQLAQAILENTG